jgi:hypothetical protein
MNNYFGMDFHIIGFAQIERLAIYGEFRLVRWRCRARHDGEAEASLRSLQGALAR